MGGEPVLADIDPVDETALDHVPAKPALQATEDKQTEEAGHQRAGDIARDAEADEGQKEDDADEAAEKAMGPFTPIDGLERIEAHALVDLRIFRDRFVGLEGVLPMGVR